MWLHLLLKWVLRDHWYLWVKWFSRKIGCFKKKKVFRDFFTIFRGFFGVFREFPWIFKILRSSFPSNSNQFSRRIINIFYKINKFLVFSLLVRFSLRKICYCFFLTKYLKDNYKSHHTINHSDDEKYVKPFSWFFKCLLDTFLFHMLWFQISTKGYNFLRNIYIFLLLQQKTSKSTCLHTNIFVRKLCHGSYVCVCVCVYCNFS